MAAAEPWLCFCDDPHDSLKQPTFSVGCLRQAVSCRASQPGSLRLLTSTGPPGSVSPASILKVLFQFTEVPELPRFFLELRPCIGQSMGHAQISLQCD